MADWNELFANEKNIERIPDSAVYRFADTLEELIEKRPLRIWDLCCGAGRHTVALARMGHKVYASDNSNNALFLTHKWLEEIDLHAVFEQSDMTVCPWPDITFHGVISWDALHHNTLDNIKKAVNEVHKFLIPGGLFLGTLKSTKADSYGLGKQIEPNTYVPDAGCEQGIPHHFFDEAAILNLFEGWEFISLAEQIMNYTQRRDNFFDCNPFSYTRWCILARKK